MTATRASAVPLTLGVALSTTELVAAGERGAAARRFTIDPPELDAARWPSLTDALRELAGATGTAGGTLDVALLPPLAEVRALELPPMRDDDVRLLLVNDTGGLERFAAKAAPAPWEAPDAGQRPVTNLRG